MYVIHEWSYVRFRDTHPVPFARGALYYRAGRRVEHHAMARSRVPVTAVPAPVLARGTGTGTGTDVITAHNWLVLHSTCVAAGDPADLNADASPGRQKGKYPPPGYDSDDNDYYCPCTYPTKLNVSGEKSTFGGKNMSFLPFVDCAIKK